MTNHNGPAYAAEALRRLDLADDSGELEAQHLRETAAVYATLALVAATVGKTEPNRDLREDEEWEQALRTPKHGGGSR